MLRSSDRATDAYSLAYSLDTEAYSVSYSLSKKVSILLYTALLTTAHCAAWSSSKIGTVMSSKLGTKTVRLPLSRQLHCTHSLLT